MTPRWGPPVYLGYGTDLPGFAWGSGAGTFGALDFFLGLLRWFCADAGFFKDKPYDRLKH